MVEAPPRHLTAKEVAHILEIVQDADAIVVGGQSVNLWAEFYKARAPEIAQQGPFTSKDIDFYGAIESAELLADALGGEIRRPRLDDETPNAALVVAMLGNRQIEIDFMRVVLGVDDASIKDKYVTLRGIHPIDRTKHIRMMVLHPLDCVKSRYANVNILGREDEISLKQAAVAIAVLKFFIEDRLAEGDWKMAQATLCDLYDVARREFTRGMKASRHDRLNPIGVLKAFVNHEGLDPRWRKHNLASMIRSLEAKFAGQERAQQKA